MTDQKLIEYAKEGMKQAYAPYSGFRVGAALLTRDGRIYLGCNIENASYGATNCAERTAIFKAVSEGQREFEAIAVVCSEGTPAYPCGICLQVMSEFSPDIRIILEGEEGPKSYALSDFLPNAFRLQQEKPL